MSLSIKTKIMWILLVGGFSIMALGALGLNGVRQSDSEIKKLYRDSAARVSQLGQIMALMRDSRTELLLTLQHDPRHPETLERHNHSPEMHTDKMLENIEQMGMLWQEYAGGAQSAEELKLSEEFGAKRRAFLKEAVIPSREAVLAGKYDAATRIAVTRIDPLFAAANEAMLKLDNYEKSRGKLSYQLALKHYRTTLALVLGAIVAALLFSLVLAMMTVRSVTAVSSASTSASPALTDDDLSQPVRLDAGEGAGTELSYPDTLADSLAQAAASVARNSAMVAAAAGRMQVRADQLQSLVRRLRERERKEGIPFPEIPSCSYLPATAQRRLHSSSFLSIPARPSSHMSSGSVGRL
jgi:methyl-accepting chemotaxis protein